MVKHFSFVLHHLTGQVIYTVPGEVTGKVVVVTDKPNLYKAISDTLRGDADVHIPGPLGGYVEVRSHEEIICRTIEMELVEPCRIWVMPLDLVLVSLLLH